jgi:hypothetical protein
MTTTKKRGGAGTKHSAYNARPEQKAKRAALGRVRYALEKKHGAAALKGKDVDHIKAVKDGGALDDPKNIRLLPVKKNRGRNNN